MKGQKQKTLSALSRDLPDEAEIAQLLDLIMLESDRGCALVAGALLEAGLLTAIMSRLVAVTPAERKAWTDTSDAPLSTFSQKIKIARGLGILGPATERTLSRVKDIRNAFAHALRPLNFSNPTIVSACQGLVVAKMPKLSDTGVPPARVRYASVCVGHFALLLADATANGGKEMTVNLP